MQQSVLGFALNVAKVVVGIGLLIFVHELGHFLVAKLMGVRVLKFSVGFGQRLVGFRRGETEYVLSAIPLGGYVKMVGENPGDQQTSDPRALSNQTVGRRALIFVAGVVMNVVCAFVMFIAAFQVGVRFTVAAVGEVTGPAFEAGLREGDRIKSVNGRRTPHFEDVQAIVALSHPRRALTVVVEREGHQRTFTVRPTLDDGRNLGFPTIGIAPPGSTTIAEVTEGSPAEAAGLAVGDTILALRVDTGPMIRLNTFADLQRAIRAAETRPVTLEVRSPQGVVRTQQVRLEPNRVTTFPWELGQPTILAVGGDRPAATAGLEKGDVVLEASGRPIADVAGLQEAIAENGERPMTITVRRGTETRTLTVTPQVFYPGDTAKIGVALGVDADAPPVVAHLRPRSDLAEAGIPTGSVITAVNGQPCATIAEVVELVRNVLSDEALKTEPVEFRFRTPDGEVIERRLTAEPVVVGYALGVTPEYQTEVQRSRSVLDAGALGWRKTGTSLRQVVATIRRIVFTGSVKPRNVVGPLQIADIAYKHARSGFGELLYFLAILGVNLAVINLLPIPILDGGQLVFLAIEKVKGKPLNERVQAFAQYVGLVLILALFVYVVTQDVLKFRG